MGSKRPYLLYLDDIKISIDRIFEYTANMNFDQFKKDYKTVDAVIRNFEVLGEAAHNLPVAFKSKYPDVPWNEMYLLRNKITHEYFGIDYEIIWDIINNYLPANKRQIESIRKENQG